MSGERSIWSDGDSGCRVRETGQSLIGTGWAQRRRQRRPCGGVLIKGGERKAGGECEHRAGSEVQPEKTRRAKKE